MDDNPYRTNIFNNQFDEIKIEGMDQQSNFPNGNPTKQAKMQQYYLANFGTSFSYKSSDFSFRRIHWKLCCAERLGKVQAYSFALGALSWCSIIPTSFLINNGYTCKFIEYSGQPSNNCTKKILSIVEIGTGDIN